MHDLNVNAVARYPRIFTVNPFTLLMDHNRFWLSEPFGTQSRRPCSDAAFRARALR